MFKLTAQEKIQAVKRYFEGIESQHTVAKSVLRGQHSRLSLGRLGYELTIIAWRESSMLLEHTREIR